VIKWYLNQEGRQWHRGRLSAGLRPGAAPLCVAAAALTLAAVAAPASATQTGAPIAGAPAVASPAFPGRLYGVPDISPGDVWAVGGTTWFGPSQTLADRWNGRSWTRVSTPNPPGGGYFNVVASTSADNAWAVGVVGPGPGVRASTIPLIERWNGRRWTEQSFKPVPGGGLFAGVAATSASNAWAVGQTDSADQQTLIEHWNGKRWKVLPSPNPLSGYLNLLWSASATSRDNIWAVGTTDYGSTLIVHWNGAAWS
jgi:hypothetical protein